MRRCIRHFSMASGGDGYPNVADRVSTRDIMDQATADHIAANTPINPAIQERITCATGGPGLPDRHALERI